MDTVSTDVLIVGSGPAGASAALFLSTLGVDNLVITKHRWTSPTPRAHVTNQRTMEIFRDLGIEDDLIAQASPPEALANIVFCTSLAGEELGRLRSRAADPVSGPRRRMASPAKDLDIPQHLLEPVVLGHAARRGSRVRFDTEYRGLVQSDGHVDVRVFDRVTHREFTVRATYVIGADGARSAVAEHVALPFEGEMDIAGSMNIQFSADLTPYVAHRPGGLYWFLQPGSDIGGLGMGVIRMVRPWTEWVATWGYDITAPPPRMTSDHAEKLIQQFVGDSSIPVTIRDISLWGINSRYATAYHAGRVFCVGDAVHRHPPSNGLGSNTSVQDSYNLAWKLALVLRGRADQRLLDTYSTERVPVGRHVVTRANASRREHRVFIEALGVTDTGDPQRMALELSRHRDDDTVGQRMRAALTDAVARKNYEFNAHGMELGESYRSSAVVADATPGTAGAVAGDPELHYEPTTAPGARLPHVWLGERGREVSTHDVAGKGRFALLTGICGQSWIDAAATVAEELGIELTRAVIGPGRRYTDLYGDWARRREVAEDGCVLVRPDMYVAWRSLGPVADPAAALHAVLRTILRPPGNEE